MPQFLTCTLYAPLASFGAVAVGERRPSFRRPARSAILGLIAASLGITRAEQAAHDALARGYGIAVQTLAPGSLLADYHTAQAPPARRNRRYTTRRDELADPGDIHTVLTAREYREDALFALVVWERSDAPHPLIVLADALRHPCFTLFLGRKSCPPGLPLHPRLFECADMLAALAAHWSSCPPPEQDVRRRLRARAGSVSMDRADVPEGVASSRIEFVRDEPLSRRRWQFGLREEAIVEPAPA